MGGWYLVFGDGEFGLGHGPRAVGAGQERRAVGRAAADLTSHDTGRKREEGRRGQAGWLARRGVGGCWWSLSHLVELEEQGRRVPTDQQTGRQAGRPAQREVREWSGGREGGPVSRLGARGMHGIVVWWWYPPEWDEEGPVVHDEGQQRHERGLLPAVDRGRAREGRDRLAHQRTLRPHHHIRRGGQDGGQGWSPGSR